ncbi:hypothetical protein [Shewanella gaetbuli]
MKKTNLQLYIFLCVLEFPLGAFLKGDLWFAIFISVLGILAFMKLSLFKYLKNEVPNFIYYFWGCYAAGVLFALYKYGTSYSKDYAVGVFLLINLLILPFLYKVKSVIENREIVK